MNYKNQIITGGILCATAVICGAFGAHLLKEKLSLELLESYLTGVRYHLIHGVCIVFLPALNAFIDPKSLKTASWFMLVGVLLFSGSIYFLSLKDLIGLPGLRALGPITPIGGLMLISSWLMVVWGAFKKQNL